MPLFLLPFISGAKAFFSAIITFCSKPPGSWIACAVGIALGLWWFGQHEFNKGVAHQLAIDAEAIAKLKPKQAKLTERIRIVYVQKEAEIKWRTKFIQGKVAEYVTPKDDAACTVNNGFVRVHDAAAKDAVPGSPAGTDGKPSGVALSTVSKTVAGNYGICHLAFSRLKEWQEWYAAQKALAEK